MKKLLILSTVFAMAASASAGLYLSGGWPGDTSWVGINAQDMPGDGSFEAYLVIADDPASQYAAEWTGEYTLHIPPALEDAYADYEGYEAGSGDIWYFLNADLTYPYDEGSNGLHVEFELDLISSVAYVVIELRGGGWELLDTLQMGWGPEIWVEPTELAFSCTQSNNPPTQTLAIDTVDFGMLFWEITENCAWLQATPTTGIVGYDVFGPNEVTVSVDACGLLPGVYNCDLTITDPIADDVIMPVELQVLARPGDFDEDGQVDCDDFWTLARAWLSESGDDNWNPDCDISDPNDEVIDGRDFGVFAMDWDECGDPPPPAPGVSYNIENCDPGAKGAAGDKDALRFSATAGGNYILFEDMMVANCCAMEVWLEMTVEDDLITLYELEYTPIPCTCICDWPVTATLGPFETGTYTLEVYEDWGGFIGNTIVTIE